MTIQNARQLTELQREFTGYCVDGVAICDLNEDTVCTDNAAARIRGVEIELMEEEVRDEIISICHEVRRTMNPIKEEAASLIRGDVGWDARAMQAFLRSVVSEMDRLSGVVAGLPDFAIAKESGTALHPKKRPSWEEEDRSRTASILNRNATGIITAGDLKIDLLSCRVTAEGREVKLTPTEFKLLCYLASHTGKVVPHGELLDHLWGPEYRNRRGYLRVFVSQLRRKIEPNPKQPKYVLTVSSWGYCFRKQDP